MKDDISEYLIKILLNMNRVKKFEKGKYYIYVKNLSINKGRKYIFKLDKYNANKTSLYNLQTETCFNDADPSWFVDTSGVLQGQLKRILTDNSWELYKKDLAKRIKKTAKKLNIDIHDVLEITKKQYLGLKNTNHILDTQCYTINTDSTNINVTENKTMSDKMKDVMKVNSNAAKAAAQLTAGKTINAALLEKVKPYLPLMVRGYADTPVAPIILANMVNLAVEQFASDNEKAVWAADAMLVAAMADFMGSFNIEKILSEVLATIEVKIPEQTEG